jgi:hypothetical protein
MAATTSEENDGDAERGEWRRWARAREWRRRRARRMAGTVSEDSGGGGLGQENGGDGERGRWRRSRARRVAAAG